MTRPPLPDRRPPVLAPLTPFVPPDPPPSVSTLPDVERVSTVPPQFATKPSATNKTKRLLRSTSPTIPIA
jgi:hypothetical protein